VKFRYMRYPHMGGANGEELWAILEWIFRRKDNDKKDRWQNSELRACRCCGAFGTDDFDVQGAWELDGYFKFYESIFGYVAGDTVGID
jgi:hypothetical protein